MKQYKINENTTVAQVQDLVAADIDGETMMMRIESGKYYGLDTVGSRIWELIAQPQQVSQVVGSLAAEYDVTREQCRDETIDFINHLYNEGLVRIE